MFLDYHLFTFLSLPHISVLEPAQIIPCYGKTNTRWLRDFSLKIDPYSTQIFWLLLPYFETALSFGNWWSQYLLFFPRLFLIKFSLSISWNKMSLWTLKCFSTQVTTSWWQAYFMLMFLSANGRIPVFSEYDFFLSPTPIPTECPCEHFCTDSMYFSSFHD